jgi:hypothetical protein
MHLVFVTSLVPDGKPTTGFEVANEAIVAGLRVLGHKVTVIGFRLPRQQAIVDADTYVLQTLDVENASASFWQKLRWLAGAFASGLPVGGSKLRVVAWAQLKTALDAAGPFDGMVINSVQMPTAFPQLLDYAPFVYVAHNVEHHSARQNALSSTGRKERLLYARDARLLQPIEEKLCKKAAHVFVLSEDDRQRFGLSEDDATTLPLVFPTRDAPDEVVTKVALSHDVGLIGSWSWQPNYVGLMWFLDEVVPLLDSDVGISIAGNIPSVPPKNCQNVRFVGRVASAEAFVAGSRVLALVSRSGTGVQLKTIEAFQAGMPCIATRSSVRGIVGIPGNCRVEDEAPGFAGALSKMVKAVRNGSLARVDGNGFASEQSQRLQQALQKGLGSLRP